MESSGATLRAGAEAEGRPRTLDPALIWTAVIGLAMVLAASADFIFPGIDARFALVWGGELADGYEASFDGAVPAKHPLTLLFGAVFSLAGPAGARAAYGAVSILSYLFLLYAVFRLGRTVAGRWAGMLAAALVAVQPELVIQGATSGKDLPFAALCMLAAALALEGTERNWVKVMAALIAAGLIRPEAWLLAGLYGLWLLWLGSPRIRRPAVIALVAFAPLVWVGTDVALTGNPMHTLDHAREKKSLKADEGLVDPTPRSSAGGVSKYLTGLRQGIPGKIGWPLTIAAVLVGGWALLRRRETPGSRRGPPARKGGDAAAEHPLVILVSIVLASFAFGIVLVALGLPFVDRFLILPALIMIVIAASALARVRESPAFAAALPLAVIGALAALPGNLSDIDRALAASSATARDAAIVERIARSPVVKEAIEQCPDLVFGGSGKRGKIQLGRTIVAPALGIGLDRIPPKPPKLLRGPGDSAFAHGFNPRSKDVFDDEKPGTFAPTAVRDGRWLFASLCAVDSDTP